MMTSVKRAILAMLGLLVIIALVIALAAGLVTATDWANERWGSGPGTLPGWLEAISTFAAFIAAVIAVVFAAGAFGLEVRRENRWRVDARRAQASLVAAWIEERTSGEDFRGSLRMRIPHTELGVALRNASELPVTSVSVLLTWPGGDSVHVAALDTLPPGPEPRFIAFMEDAVVAIKTHRSEPQLRLSFTDAASIIWFRAEGKLEEVGTQS